ncbi:MAG TPA: TerB N-terminal domain-containing protein, partial [Coleofasciculaceae cyanobacterium]
MEFRPFWDLLEQLGIVLPNASKLQGNQPDKLTRATRSRRAVSIPSAPRPSNAAELLELLNATAEAVPEAADDSLTGRNTRLETRSEHFWLPPGKTVNVAGYEIPGMVYVGEGLSSINNARASETSLINPQLKVKRDRPDIEGQQMPYSTSYSQMPPACRAAYLDWLATGRCNPDIYIGYIWLFFYGLERRVFHDLLNVNFQTQQSKRQELDQIVAEVERLNQVYGGQRLSGGIRYKVETFLEICQIVKSANLSESIDPLTAKSLVLQVGLGQLVEQGRPIPADWALAWYSRLSSYALPIAASRCVEEFQALFRLRYTQQYGEGMKLKAGKSRLTTVYYPASQSFWSRAVTVPLGNLPDVTRFAAKVRKIGEVVETCRTELESLSRFLGRNPNSRNTHSAIALLPADLLSTYGGDLVQQLQQWLNQLFANPEQLIAVVSGQDLLQQWSGANPEKLTKAEATGLSKVLELLGYGIEPDLRFGGAAPTLKNKAALFRLSQPHPAALSDQYYQSTLLAHLAIVVASGNESPSSIEQQFLTSYLQETVELEAAE